MASKLRLRKFQKNALELEALALKVMVGLKVSDFTRSWEDIVGIVVRVHEQTIKLFYFLQNLKLAVP